MNSPDTAPPAEQKCPNCGTMSPLGFAMCPRCGMQLSAPSKAIYGCAILLFQSFLALLALGFGASGACFAYFGVADATPNSISILLIGLLLLALAWLCIRGIIQIKKSRK